VNALARNLRLAGHAARYELAKTTVFRTGFLFNEVLRGVGRPIVMLFLFHAVYATGRMDTIGGYTPLDTIHYLILVALCDKLVFHDRALDLSLQIFEGWVTKYLVMPLRYFVLAAGRWLQFAALQLAVVPVLWAVGALVAPRWWPLPADGVALAEALCLVLVGSWCHLLLYFTLHSLAFFLDVVWSLLVMTRFAVVFVAGGVLPVAMMPDAVARAFEWLFPYWTMAGPIEIYLGRRGHADFLFGLAVLLGSAFALEFVRRSVWRLGVRRYSGSGM
jgi:ABC-2 type transport system permease protein